MIFDSPVYPLCPSFIDERDKNILETHSTKKYINFLENNGVKHIMTTAGTSQFNLLSIAEIRKLNKTLLEFRGSKIIGIPQLSLQHIKEEIKYYNTLFEGKENVYFLILFPERYYDDEQIVNFFKEINDVSNHPFLSHCNTLRKGYGGNYIYENNLLKKLSIIPNFIGIKEESPTIDFSIKEMTSLNLEIIVAGGSMRRFWCLHPFGATTYLSGVGSFFPHLEEKFFDRLHLYNGLEDAKLIMQNIEYPLFEVFMDIGWHASMRYVLHTMGFIRDNRDPFIKIKDEEKRRIKSVINNIKEYEDIYNWTV
jgi:dihydrodipicolinate synthase/N-acetylneuraminate lyase